MTAPSKRRKSEVRQRQDLIAFRVSAHEGAAIRAAASNAQVSVSAWVRSRALDEGRQDPAAPPATPDPDQD